MLNLVGENYNCKNFFVRLNSVKSITNYHYYYRAVLLLCVKNAVETFRKLFETMMLLLVNKIPFYCRLKSWKLLFTIISNKIIFRFCCTFVEAGVGRFFAEIFFIFTKKYMLQYVNAGYYPLPPKTDG